MISYYHLIFFLFQYNYVIQSLGYFNHGSYGCQNSKHLFSPHLPCQAYECLLLPSHISIDPLLVLIEYVPYGDLLGYLRKSRGLNDTYFKDPDVKPQTNLTAEQLMRFAYQVADGMLYLSSRKVWLLCYISTLLFIYNI